MVARVDDLCAHLLGEATRAVVQIGGDHFGRAVMAGDSDGEQSDRTRTDDRDALAPHVARTPDAMPRDGCGLGERAESETHPLRQRGEHAGGQRDPVGEPALRVRQMHRRAEIGRCGSEVRPVGGVSRHTVTARRERVHGDPHPDTGTRPVSGRPHDRARELVPEDHRLPQDGCPGRAVPPVVQIRPADPAVRDLHDRLVGRGLRLCDALRPEVPRCVRHDGEISHVVVLFSALPRRRDEPDRADFDFDRLPRPHRTLTVRRTGHDDVPRSESRPAGHISEALGDRNG